MNHPDMIINIHHHPPTLLMRTLRPDLPAVPVPVIVLHMLHQAANPGSASMELIDSQKLYQLSVI